LTQKKSFNLSVWDTENTIGSSQVKAEEVHLKNQWNKDFYDSLFRFLIEASHKVPLTHSLLAATDSIHASSTD
jgi:hypothetical protein